MKQLLLAGLMLCAVPAYANDKLPVHILGRWCYSNASTEAQEVYFRSDRGCSDATDGITINPNGYESDAPTDYPDICLFDKIKRKDTDTYVVHVHCKLAEMEMGREASLVLKEMRSFNLLMDYCSRSEAQKVEI